MSRATQPTSSGCPGRGLLEPDPPAGGELGREGSPTEQTRMSLRGWASELPVVGELCLLKRECDFSGNRVTGDVIS